MSDPAEKSARCGCGYSAGDPWVVPRQRYSLFGWFMMSLGISHPPKRISIECDHCGRVFEEIRGDGKFLNDYYSRNR